MKKVLTWILQRSLEITTLFWKNRPPYLYFPQINWVTPIFIRKRNISQNIAVIIQNKVPGDIIRRGNHYYFKAKRCKYKNIKLLDKQGKNVKEEKFKFYNHLQFKNWIGSGFFTQDDLFVSAGHIFFKRDSVLKDKKFLASIFIIFNHNHTRNKISENNFEYLKIHTNNIAKLDTSFKLNQSIFGEYITGDIDWSAHKIKFIRKKIIPGIKLKEVHNKLKKRIKIYGHPIGLKLTLAKRGKITKYNDKRIHHTLDILDGYSGAPIFYRRKRKLIGIQSSEPNPPPPGETFFQAVQEDNSLVNTATNINYIIKKINNV